MIKKILITGSSGTIGTRLCEKLLEKNYTIIGVDKKSNTWNSEIGELTIIGDLRDENIFEKLPKDIDIVIHLAANARVYELVKKPILAMENFEISFNILEFCRKNNIQRFIFTSSREVYGNSGKIPYIEEVDITNCESPYAASKIGGEVLAYSYSKCYDIDFVVVRFSNVYGMYDNSDRVIPLFIKLSKEKKDLVIYGKEKLLDFTYIDDTITGIIRCIENFEKIKNNVFNISSGKGTTITSVAQLIQKYMNCDNKVSFEENRIGEVVKYVADISKAKNKIDYRSEIDIEEGLKRSIQWYMNFKR